MFFLKGNSFQSIVATDGTLSYAIFTYQCGGLSWSNRASIGFSITQDFFANHELSLTSNVSDIACASANEWNNVIYQVGYGMLGNLCSIILIFNCLLDGVTHVHVYLWPP